MFSRPRGSGATGGAVRSGASVSGQVSGQPVGYRAALSGLLAAVAAAVVGAVMIQVAVDASGEPVNSAGAMAGQWTLSAADALADDPSATAEELADSVEDWTPNGEERYGQAYFPLSLGLLLPVIGAALAFRAVSKRASAKVVNRAMYVTLFGTLLNAQLLFIFLPTVVGIGIAAFQVRKAEVQAGGVAAGADDTDPEADDTEVIEVDEVEVEVDEVEADELAEDDSFLDAEEAADPDAEAAERTVFGRLRRRP